MNRTFGWVIVITLAVGCLAFLWGTFSAGVASIKCNAPAAQVLNDPLPKPEIKYCDPDTKQPHINPLLSDLVVPLAATLGTFFGAAIGIARKDHGLSRNRTLSRWGALVFEDDPLLARLQTYAGYSYLLGLVMAFVFLYYDAGIEGSTNTPFTHVIIKSEGQAAIGVIIGVVALVLGVRPADR